MTQENDIFLFSDTFINDNDFFNLYNLENDKKDIDSLIFPSNLAKPKEIPSDDPKKDQTISNIEPIILSSHNESQSPKRKINVLSPHETKSIIDENIKTTNAEIYCKEFKKNGFKKTVPDGVIFNSQTQKFEKIPAMEELEKEFHGLENDESLDRKNYYAKPVSKDLCEKIRQNPEKASEIITEASVKKINSEDALKDYNKLLLEEMFEKEEKSKEKEKYRARDKEKKYDKKRDKKSDKNHSQNSKGDRSKEKSYQGSSSNYNSKEKKDKRSKKERSSHSRTRPENFEKEPAYQPQTSVFNSSIHKSNNSHPLKKIIDDDPIDMGFAETFTENKKIANAKKKEDFIFNFKVGDNALGRNSTPHVPSKNQVINLSDYTQQVALELNKIVDGDVNSKMKRFVDFVDSTIHYDDPFIYQYIKLRDIIDSFDKRIITNILFYYIWLHKSVVESSGKMNVPIKVILEEKKKDIPVERKSRDGGNSQIIVNMSPDQARSPPQQSKDLRRGKSEIRDQSKKNTTDMQVKDNQLQKTQEKPKKENSQSEVRKSTSRDKGKSMTRANTKNEIRDITIPRADHSDLRGKSEIREMPKNKTSEIRGKSEIRDLRTREAVQEKNCLLLSPNNTSKNKQDLVKKNEKEKEVYSSASNSKEFLGKKRTQDLHEPSSANNNKKKREECEFVPNPSMSSMKQTPRTSTSKITVPKFVKTLPKNKIKELIKKDETYNMIMKNFQDLKAKTSHEKEALKKFIGKEKYEVIEAVMSGKLKKNVQVEIYSTDYYKLLFTSDLTKRKFEVLNTYTNTC